jgi:hypothetical protein
VRDKCRTDLNSLRRLLTDHGADTAGDESSDPDGETRFQNYFLRNSNIVALYWTDDRHWILMHGLNRRIADNGRTAAQITAALEKFGRSR